MHDCSPSEFQWKVYEAVSLVPEGCVTTYALLATHIGCKSCRAVGQALRRNPFAPRVPCHRVIAADLSPGGFRGRRSGAEVARKKTLLAREGVRFVNDRLVDISRVFCFSPSIEDECRR